MKSRFLAALLLAAAAPALAQQAPVPLPIVPAQIAAVRDAALQDQYAWDITEGLTTEVGPRLAGTPAEARARDWAVAKLRSLGFSNVRVENFTITNWTRGPESAEIIAPFPQRLVIAALGNQGVINVLSSAGFQNAVLSQGVQTALGVLIERVRRLL